MSFATRTPLKRAFIGVMLLFEATRISLRLVRFEPRGYAWEHCPRPTLTAGAWDFLSDAS